VEVSAASLHQTVCHSQLPSLLWQNIRWMLHPHTLPATASQCYSYIIATDRTDGQGNMRRAWWGVCGRRRDGQMRVRAGTSPSSPCLSPSMPPPHGSESWGPVRSQNMDGRATRYTAALVDRWVATTMSSPTVNLCRLQMIWLSFWTVSWQWLDTFRPFAVQPFSSYVSCGLFAISDDQGDACLRPGLHYNTITSPQ